MFLLISNSVFFFLKNKLFYSSLFYFSCAFSFILTAWSNSVHALVSIQALGLFQLWTHYSLFSKLLDIFRHCRFADCSFRCHFFFFVHFLTCCLVVALQPSFSVSSSLHLASQVLVISSFCFLQFWAACIHTERKKKRYPPPKFSIVCSPPITHVFASCFPHPTVSYSPLMLPFVCLFPLCLCPLLSTDVSSAAARKFDTHTHRHTRTCMRPWAP